MSVDASYIQINSITSSLFPLLKKLDIIYFVLML